MVAAGSWAFVAWRRTKRTPVVAAVVVASAVPLSVPSAAGDHVTPSGEVRSS